MLLKGDLNNETDVSTKQGQACQKPWFLKTDVDESRQTNY
jgi:hypothetical protein